jgi:hypothetical protein
LTQGGGIRISGRGDQGKTSLGRRTGKGNGGRRNLLATKRRGKMDLQGGQQHRIFPPDS